MRLVVPQGAEREAPTTTTTTMPLQGTSARGARCGRPGLVYTPRAVEPDVITIIARDAARMRYSTFSRILASAFSFLLLLSLLPRYWAWLLFPWPVALAAVSSNFELTRVSARERPALMSPDVFFSVQIYFSGFN